MRIQTKYEEILLKEIRTLPPPVLPQAVKMLRSLREGVKKATTRRKTSADPLRTGFCGAWKDNRHADEIVADIVVHRRGFGRRKVDL